MVLVEDILAVDRKENFDQACRGRVVLAELQALGLRGQLVAVRKEAGQAAEELRGRVELVLVPEALQGWALLSQLAAVRKLAVLARVGLVEHKEVVPARVVLEFEDLFDLAARLVELERKVAVQVEVVQVALVRIAAVLAVDQQEAEKHRYNTTPQHPLLDVLAVEHSQLEAE